ncbi:hypothetical protein BHE90_004487 [Fusarium euwallaceae]|uniref:AB hydrolase-1 domain-containing protein n=2 Tax=Fusarium solani species complex TaxID=232080 RepID=A0A3M2S030_9HYPO|nr:hypothetical protein CDV36_009457 [Fusarium kuroshium]RTE80996.1 hypothetical protein BHE90_004487 [Fusarium euwallaceae]
MAPYQPGITTLVDLGTHKLELTIYGPPRRAHNPIVIVIPGIGSSVKEWSAVTKSLSESMSVMNYERAGYGLSDPAPDSDSRTAEDIAAELHALLRAAKVAPPYIVVSHSYGGIILREFVKLRTLAQFKGFVFVDANTEETPLTYPNPFVRAIQGDIDTLKLCYGDCYRLGHAEWQALLEEKASPGYKVTVDREVTQYYESGKALAAKGHSESEGPEFGRVPLVVLQADHAVDLKKIYAEGVRLGNGTDDERAGISQFITQANLIEDSMQKKILKLSERTKFQHLLGFGHGLHLAAPETVVDAVIWILMQYRC